MLDHAAVANGKHRDSILTDIVHWRLPTLSPEADDRIRKLVGLSDTKQWETLEQQLEEWLRGVEIMSVSRWLGDPTIYLADFEPGKVAELAQIPNEQLTERVRDAKARGWEVD